jgi:recombination protein RecA
VRRKRNNNTDDPNPLGHLERSPENAAVAKLLKDVEQTHGVGAAFVARAMKPFRTIPTGSIALDIATGIGGWPAGRIVEIFGPPGGGKSTLALTAIVQAQTKGGYAAFIDADMTFDASYATRLGIDLDRLIISQPDTGEQGLDIAEMLIRSGAVDIVVIDSLPALVPRIEIEGEFGEDHEEYYVELISRGVRKLLAPSYRWGSLLFLVNQIYIRHGVIRGNPETTPGGELLKAEASMRLDVRSRGPIERDGRVAGNRVRIRIIKNNLAAPFRAAEFDLLFGKGICRCAEYFDLAVMSELIVRRGGQLLFGPVVLGADRETAIRKLSQDSEIALQLERLLTENLRRVEETMEPYTAHVLDKPEANDEP